MISATPFLDRIDTLQDLRALNEDDLPALAAEIRTEMIETVSQTGGHLGANLGVVELTLALHFVFHTPEDKLIWDVGHQAYPHKMLTGRRAMMPTLRQGGDYPDLPNARKAPTIPLARDTVQRLFLRRWECVWARSCNTKAITTPLPSSGMGP